MEEKNIEQKKDLSLHEKVLRGSTWTMFGFGFSRVLRLGSHLLLAWLLAPEIFGLMALIKVFLNGLGMFSDIGIGPSIIQSKRGDDPKFLNTAWSVQLVRGAVLWLITCLLALPFSWFYAKSDPMASQLAYLLPVAGVTVLINGFKHPVMFTLSRDLKLGRITLIELATQLISLAIIFLWALIKPNVWALIAGNIGSALFSTIISHTLVAKHPVRFFWDRKSIKEIVAFGKWIILSTAFTFFSSNLDKLILGRILSMRELGLYGIATTLTKMALDITSRLGSSIMFPVYSRLQDNLNKLMSVALKSRNIVLWIGSAVSIVMAVASPLFFQSFWDERYHFAGVLAQWLVINMWARILFSTMDRISLSLGNSKSLFISNVIQTIGIFAAALGYLAGALPGFILGLTLGPVAAHIYLTFIIPEKKKEMLFQSAVFTMVTLIIGGVSVFFVNWLEQNAPHYLWIAGVLSISIVCCFISFIIVFIKIKQTGVLNKFLNRSENKQS